jgi:hypothetical protein
MSRKERSGFYQAHLLVPREDGKNDMFIGLGESEEDAKKDALELAKRKRPGFKGNEEGVEYADVHISRHSAKPKSVEVKGNDGKPKAAGGGKGKG